MSRLMKALLVLGTTAFVIIPGCLGDPASTTSWFSPQLGGMSVFPWPWLFG